MRTQKELENIANEKREQILEQWWNEIESWDNIIEEYDLSEEEIRAIDKMNWPFPYGDI